MPLTAITNDEPEGYKDRPYDELIGSELGKIVYKGIEHFDEVFAEFDQIIAGNSSTILIDLFELFNNTYSYVDPKNPQAVAEFQSKIKERLILEKELLKTVEQRRDRLQEQANKQTLQLTVPPLPSRKFPTAEVLKVMDEFNIPHTTMEPEFKLILAILVTNLHIHRFNNCKNDAHVDHDTRDFIENRLNFIYMKLGMSQEANLIDRDLAEEPQKLNNIKKLLQASSITVQQFKLTLDATLKSYIIHNIEVLAEIALEHSDPNILHVFIKARELLSRINYRLPTEANLLLLMTRHKPNNLILDADVREEILRLFAEYCGVSFSQDVAHGEIYINLMRLACYIVLLVIPFGIPLLQLYTFDPANIELAAKNCELLRQLTSIAQVPAQTILQLSPETMAKLFNLALKSKTFSNNACKDLLKLPKEHIEFILSHDAYLPRIDIINKYYGISVMDFSRADLATKKTWLMQPASIKTLNSLQMEIAPEQMDLQGESPFFAIIAAQHKDYKAIAEFFSCLEITLCSSVNISVYAFALWLKDPKLIETITSSIKERTSAYLNAFLMSNGFKKIGNGLSTLPWFNTAFEVSRPLSLDTVDQNNETPLTVAIKHENVLAVLALIVHGARLDIHDMNNLNPLELARRIGNKQIYHDILYTLKHLNRLQIICHPDYASNSAYRAY